MNSGDGSLPSHIAALLIPLTLILNGLTVLVTASLNDTGRSVLDRQPAKKHIDRFLSALLDAPGGFQFTGRLLGYLFFTAGLILTLTLPEHRAVYTVLYVAASVAFCEYFTRKLAHQHSGRIATGMAGAAYFFVILLKPVVFLLDLIPNIVLKLFKQTIKFEDEGYSEDQVMSILEEGQQSGQIKEEGKKMINSIFEFDDELAYEIMTPRTDVFLIDINDPPEEYLDSLMELRYSRIPVCEDETDNIIGILHIKDYLIKAREEGFDNVDIRPILRKPYFVPETKNIDSLFFELQREKQHIAVLIDEYGGFSGIVTMEDIVEEIVGEIDDEYDEEEHIIEKVGEGVYDVDGDVSLDDLNEELGTDLESETSETIGGFLIDILGEIPEDGDKEYDVPFENFVFSILSVKERRIERIRVSTLPCDTEEDNDRDK